MTTALRRKPSGGLFRRQLVLIWAVLAAILVWIAWSAIVNRELPDADDHMRLQQVRDLLAGQSWFDTRQHRMNPPAGAPMHWSRLVDLPLALVMLALRPLLGSDLAELVAMTIVPLFVFGLMTWLSAHLVRRFAGEQYALLSAVLLPSFTLVWIQITPLRIDHHGWQIVLALSAISAVFLPDARRSGFLAGVAMVLWLAISVEGLPLAAAVGSLLALRWAVKGQESERLETYVWTLAGASCLVLLSTSAPQEWASIHCDALTLPYVGAFAVVGAGVSAARRLPLGRVSRFVALCFIAALGLAALGSVAPVCLKGPFAELDPLVRKFWYLRVSEGLPLWHQTPTVAALVIGFPLVGFAGSIWAYMRAPAEDRRDWTTLLSLAAASIAVAIMVQRGGALANILALPGGMYLLSKGLPAARNLRRAPVRLIATVAVLLFLSPWALPMAGLLLEPRPTAAEEALAARGKAARRCSSAENLAKLNSLSPANLLTPLDVAPVTLTSTHHRVVASGHHRNQTAMRDVILAFTGPVERAHRIIEARRIDYIVVCPYQNEPILFGKVAPRGLWSRLSAGRAPSWLEPVEFGNSQTLLVWRVKR